MNKFILFLFLFIWATSNTFAQQNLHKENISSNYRPDDSMIHPNYKVYHDHDTSSLILYEVNLSELQFLPNKDSTSFEAKAQIHYSLYINYKAKELIDSGSVFIFDNVNKDKDVSSIGSFPIKAKMGYSYVVKLSITDLNNGSTNHRFLEIEKLSKDTRQNYYMMASDNLPMIVNFVNRNETYRLVHRDTTITTAWVKYFPPNLKAARPPMSSGTPSKRTVHADSIYRIHFTNGISDELQFNKQGYYHIMLDSLAQKGFTVYQFTSDFPFINSPLQMVMPLRYLTTYKEFKTIINEKNKQKAVEDFWIKISGNKERARRMIGLYYNRVQQANMLFYSDREGWMTDRGMIFIVFGSPDVVYRDSDMETWIYGYQKNNKNLRFDFYKTDNPFTNSDYLLNRSPIYNSPWNISLEIWRR